MTPDASAGARDDRPVILAIGGSVIATGDNDASAWNQWAEALKEWSHVRPIGVVVGGGQPAREAIAVARGGSTSEDDLDRIGIACTRVNAQLLLAFLKGNGVDTNHNVAVTVAGGVEDLETRSVAVMGGTTPGHSTDYVAAEWARDIGAARLVIVSNVDGVYTGDPRTDPEAQRLDHATPEQLLDIIGGDAWTRAGSPGIVDGPATRLLCETGMECRVVSGRNIGNVGAAIRGDRFEGTLVAAAPLAEAA